MAQDMGMGELGKANVVFKRKFRWTFEVQNAGCNFESIPPAFVKLASRPNLSIEEQEINFLNAKMWIPGKATWETITVTYYDAVDTSGTDLSTVLEWVAQVYNFIDPIGEGNSNQASKKSGYAGDGVLTLFDGCGTAMETWQLGHMWPQAINFGELDYSSSEECTVELTLRYSEVTYTAQCGANPQTCCSGC